MATLKPCTNDSVSNKVIVTEYVCSICCETFKGINDVMNHKCAFLCEFCGDRMNNQHEMLLHLWSHLKKMSASVCTHCGSLNIGKYKLSDHMCDFEPSNDNQSIDAIPDGAMAIELQFDNEHEEDTSCQLAKSSDEIAEEPVCENDLPAVMSLTPKKLTESTSRLPDLTEHVPMNSKPSEHDLNTHQIVRCGSDVFACRLCHVRVQNVKGLLKHASSMYHQCQLSEFKCGTVNLVDEADVHSLPVSSQDGPHECVDCGLTFPQLKTLTRHRIRHSQKKAPLKCPHCSQSFSRTYRYKAHLQRHQGHLAHPCTQCDKSFVDRWSLRRHLRTHTGEKPYVCERCGGCYMHDVQLKRHRCLADAPLVRPPPSRRSRPGRQRVKCPLSSCAEIVDDENELVEHVRIAHGLSQVKGATKTTFFRVLSRQEHEDCV